MSSLPAQSLAITAGFTLGLMAAPDAPAKEAELQLLQTVDRLEQSLNARFGLVASTFKSMLCGNLAGL